MPWGWGRGGRGGPAVVDVDIVDQRKPKPMVVGIDKDNGLADGTVIPNDRVMKHLMSPRSLRGSRLSSRGGVAKSPERREERRSEFRPVF